MDSLIANKNQENIITGCQSQVWLHAKKEDNKVVFTADSDAIMTKGIIAMLIRVLSGQKAENIINKKNYLFHLLFFNYNIIYN